MKNQLVAGNTHFSIQALRVYDQRAKRPAEVSDGGGVAS